MLQKSINYLNEQKKKKERLRAEGEEKLIAETVKPFRNYLEKVLEEHKAYAALYFWVEYRANKNSNIESVASQTLKEIASLGIWDENADAAMANYRENIISCSNREQNKRQ